MSPSIRDDAQADECRRRAQSVVQTQEVEILRQGSNVQGRGQMERIESADRLGRKPLPGPLEDGLGETDDGPA